MVAEAGHESNRAQEVVFVKKDRYRRYNLKPQRYRYTRMWRNMERLGWATIFGLLFASMVLLWAGAAK